MQALAKSRLWVQILVWVADLLIRVHELSELGQKYWLQFAKLLNSNMFPVYNKDSPPKTVWE